MNHENCAGRVAKAEVRLLPSYVNLDYIGDSIPVASWEGKVAGVESLLSGGTIEIAGVTCMFVEGLDSYDETANTITLRGRATDSGAGYVGRMKSLGWTFDDVTLRRLGHRGHINV